MTTTSNLNENEVIVLKAIADEIKHCTGGEFGYLSDVKVNGFTKPQLKGYFSQLVQKGMITYPDDEFGCTFMTTKGIEAIGYNQDDYVKVN